jgi:mono/diheme cytochrome c family protein
MSRPYNAEDRNYPQNRGATDGRAHVRALTHAALDRSRSGPQAAAISMSATILATLIVLIGAIKVHAAGDTGDYTTAQATAGAQVYSQNCAKCHGATLLGEQGPALAGPKFADSLAYSKMPATQLYNIVSTQMPLDKPGSLSSDEYAGLFAYMLSQNGYPAGVQPLSQATLGQVQLLPYPAGPQSASAQ